MKRIPNYIDSHDLPSFKKILGDGSDYGTVKIIFYVEDYDKSRN